jgi:hypothetical protein
MGRKRIAGLQVLQSLETRLYKWEVLLRLMLPHDEGCLTDELTELE